MELIPYLGEGDAASAANWNTLWEEADRKLAIALDNKPIFFWPSSSVEDPAGVFRAGFEGAAAKGWYDLVGKKFFFLGGSGDPFFCERTLGYEYRAGNIFRDEDYSRALSVGGYNHEVFQSAEASAVPLSSQIGSVTAAPIHCDHERKILFIQPIENAFWELIGRPSDLVQFGFFSHSLQAHRKPFLPVGTGGEAHAVFVDGRIDSIVIDAPGTYNLPPRIVITGDGSGATAEARLYSPSLFTGARSDTLHEIRVTNGGEGYTNATIEIIPVEASLEPYWILEGRSDGLNSRSLEYIRKYDQAELIFEGVGGLDIPQTWDKYNFFRLHNFNSFEIVVSFPTGFSVTIPALSSKCVRRDSATSGYLEGFKYFHRFKSGDAASYAMSGNAAGNNVANPSLLFKLCRRLRYGAASEDASPRVVTDESLMWDASGVYCGDGKPFPDCNDGAMIGDLMHHRGNVHLMNTGGALVQTFTFNGWVNFLNQLQTAGATVAEDPTTAQVTIQFNGSITATGSNVILATSDRIANGLTGAGWAIPQITIGKKVWPIYQHNEQLQIFNSSFRLDNNGSPQFDHATTLTYNRKYGHYLAFTDIVAGTPTPRIGQGRVIYQEQSVADLKRLNWNGEPNYAGTDQANVYTEFTASFSFTGFGPMLIWEKKIKPEALEWTPGIITRFGSGTNRHLDDDGNLIEKDWINFHHGGFTDYDATTITGHCSPRAPRVFIHRRTKGAFNILAAIDERSYTADGLPVFAGYSGEKKYINVWERVRVEDKSPYTWHGGQSKHKEIKLLRKFSNPHNLTAILGQWQAGHLSYFDVLGQSHLYYDTLDSFGNDTLDHDRVHDELMPLLVDHYNNLASVINAITRIEPLGFTGLFQELASNDIGIFGSTIRPRNHFATVATQAQRDLWSYFGVRIRSELDLPVGYSALVNANDAEFRTVQETNNIERFNLQAPLLNARWKKFLFGNENAAQGSYEWVAVEDVQELAERLGFKFYFHRLATPLKFEIFEGSGPSVLVTEIENRDNNYFPRSEAASCPARFPCFVPASENIEWISTPSTYRIHESDAADIFTFRFPHYDSFIIGPGNGSLSGTRRYFENGYQLASISVDAAFRKQNTPSKVSLPSGFTTQPAAVPGAMIFQAWGSTAGSHKLLTVPSYALNYGSGFSSVSNDNAKARNILGYRVIPGAFVPESGSAEVIDVVSEAIASGGPSLVYAFADWTIEA